jgi:hypothetical protein
MGCFQTLIKQSAACRVVLVGRARRTFAKAASLANKLGLGIASGLSSDTGGEDETENWRLVVVGGEHAAHSKANAQKQQPIVLGLLRLRKKALMCRAEERAFCERRLFTTGIA